MVSAVARLQVCFCLFCKVVRNDINVPVTCLCGREGTSYVDCYSFNGGHWIFVVGGVLFLSYCIVCFLLSTFQATCS